MLLLLAFLLLTTFFYTLNISQIGAQSTFTELKTIGMRYRSSHALLSDDNEDEDGVDDGERGYEGSNRGMGSVYGSLDGKRLLDRGVKGW